MTRPPLPIGTRVRNQDLPPGHPSGKTGTMTGTVIAHDGIFHTVRADDGQIWDSELANDMTVEPSTEPLLVNGQPLDFDDDISIYDDEYADWLAEMEYQDEVESHYPTVYCDLCERDGHTFNSCPERDDDPSTPYETATTWDGPDV